MKLTKNTTDYKRYDLETTPPTMVIVSKEGIITLEQDGKYVTITKGELRQLIGEIFDVNI